MKILSPPNLPNFFATFLAIVAHLALCLFHRIRGYTRPGTSPEHDPEHALTYDIDLVDSWKRSLDQYCKGSFSFMDQRVLELGPGPDLGVGVILRAIGAQSYMAVDVNPLALRAPPSFYDLLLKRIGPNLGQTGAVTYLKDEVLAGLAGKESKISYKVFPNFDLSVLENGSFDLVVSQAAAEHFIDPVLTIKQISVLIRQGGLLLFQIDMKTHTPWLRDIDPLSIYRVPSWLYNRTSYPGVPNRVRTSAYIEALEQAGFGDILLISQQELTEESITHSVSYLAPEFRRDKFEMKVMSCVIAARRK